MEIEERLRKARRVLAVQAAMERLAAWSSMELDHRDALLRQRRENLLRFLAGETALGDVFSATVLRRLHELAESQAALKLEKDARDARRVEQRLRLRRLERIVDGLDQTAREADILRELERTIEAAQRRAHVRPGQG
jgi:hypothetical protein